MRKLFAFLVAMLLVGGIAYGIDVDSSDNIAILGPRMGPAGATPATEVIKVYDNDTGTGNSEHLAMVWDVSSTSTGYYVKRASQNQGQDGQTDAFAGVMISPTSKDSSHGGTGYMAVRGIVACKAGGSVTAGNRLTLSGSTSSGTLNAITVGRVSGDVGTALEDISSGATGKIWLD